LEKKLLEQLAKEHNLPKELVNKLVEKATKVRYQQRAMGFKDEISDLIKEYANDKMDNK